MIKEKKETRLESTGTSSGIRNLDFGLWTLDFFYGLRMTQSYQLNHPLSKRHFFGGPVSYRLPKEMF